MQTIKRLAGLALTLFALLSAAAQPSLAIAIETPARVWDEPFERADLLLFSTHADDEHLYFAGILPYAVANGIRAQVVYMVNHDNHPARNAERENGLWEAGVRNLPVVGPFPDKYSESLEEAIEGYARAGYCEDDFVAFCVENIRRFKPLVVVGHDVNGEYGHGGHMLSAASLMKAVWLSGDESYGPESIEAYGAWDPPKTYVHLWEENGIYIDIDSPLDYFNGLSAFNVSQNAFAHHKTQHWTGFYRWLYGTEEQPIASASQIRRYSPARYGLYRSTVGDDPEGAADFYSNVTLIKDADGWDSVPEEPDWEEEKNDSSEEPAAGDNETFNEVPSESAETGLNSENGFNGENGFENVENFTEDEIMYSEEN
ncbi:MAG: PIG-L family deacetylase, partial [Defluviitaleaceae bacterium]|nr:PIG-L family deacetylase [Defluviitaleaceae bacterium]